MVFGSPKTGGRLARSPGVPGERGSKIKTARAQDVKVNSVVDGYSLYFIFYNILWSAERAAVSGQSPDTTH